MRAYPPELMVDPAFAQMMREIEAFAPGRPAELLADWSAMDRETQASLLAIVLNHDPE